MTTQWVSKTGAKQGNQLKPVLGSVQVDKHQVERPKPSTQLGDYVHSSRQLRFQAERFISLFWYWSRILREASCYLSSSLELGGCIQRSFEKNIRETSIVHQKLPATK